MTPTSYARRLARCVRFAWLAGAAVVAVGLLTLAGWTFDVEALRSGIPGLTAMNPGGTALGLVLAGSALWLQAHGTASDRRHVVGKVFAALVVAIAGARFVGYLFSWDAGPDQWLFHDLLQREATRLGYANRSAPNTATALLFIGLALLLLDVRIRGRSPAAAPALAAAFLALLTLI